MTLPVSSALEPGEVVLCRRTQFCAAHRLYNADKSEGWNQAKFGACSNPNWHGHNYELEVHIAGRPDPDTGMIMNFSELNQLIDELIIYRCDHKNLNMEVDFLAGRMTTAENLVVAIWNELKPHITGGRLFCVKLYETSKNWAEYRG